MSGPIAILSMSVGPVYDQKLERDEPGQILWSPSEKLEDGVGDLSIPMVAGLVGAALQRNMRKKEMMATMHGERFAGDQEAAKEQSTQEPNPDDPQAPPKAA